MESELAALRVLIGEGATLLALLLAILTPLGLAVSAMGQARLRNRIGTLSTLILLFPFVFLMSYIFGWMFSFAFASGPGFTGGFQSAWHAVPWADLLGPGFHTDGDGAFRTDSQDFLRYVILAWLACVLVSACAMERMKLGAHILLAALSSGFCVALALAWGGSGTGWMVTLMGYHDPVGVTTVATVAGGFALGVLRILGPRVAALDARGRVQQIAASAPGLVLAGLVMLFVGVIGLALAAITLMKPVTLGETVSFVSTNIYGAPVDPAGVVLNITAALVGGLFIGTILTRANLVKSGTLALAGLVGALPAADFFNPLQTVLLAMFLAWACGVARDWLERKFSLDDVIGTVALFGFAGVWGLMATGILLWGIPTTMRPEDVHINPFGSTTAALILFWVLGFLPGNILARILRYADGLRLDPAVELVGSDLETLRDIEVTAEAAHQCELKFLRETYQEGG